MKVKNNEEISAFLKPFADELNVRIIEVEFKQGKNPALTVYIDKDGGMDLDTCEKFHNLISDPLDTLDPTFGVAYTLNVSSPGADRAFKTDEDFLRHIGERVEIKLATPIKGKKFYDGVLCEYDGKTVKIKIDEKNMFTVDLKNLVKMNEYIDF